MVHSIITQEYSKVRCKVTSQQAAGRGLFVKEEAVTLSGETVNALRARPQAAAQRKEMDFSLLVQLQPAVLMLY